ncbi:hypothetical protein G7Y31_04390 [Corynebacterium lizhenjunii]|uniref:Uncharacterized protein n=1 Tax=Corynebacterium lizhenjunii TaxID=2709394 RepID=A0A7T0PCP2_9CORY|nr:hypothetical protein [Corynebacterium lizhenjunii]QPK79937.1 hypothetical protein G7Y31_04390 [Corynebacterium lizhenjunii]
MPPLHRTLSTLGVASMACLALAGCAQQTPHPQRHPSTHAQVRIAVDPSRVEQLILGEVYIRTLAKQGRDATLVRVDGSTSAERLDRIRSGDADFIVGCTGNFLNGLDHATAKKLEKEQRQAHEQQQRTGQRSDRDFLAETHIAMMGALPAEVTTVDPSPAPGCHDREEVDLPQNYVVVYEKNLLNREERFQVASVTKYISSQDIEQLTQDAEASGSIAETVGLWIETQTTSSGEGEGTANSDGSGSTGGGSTIS